MKPSPEELETLRADAVADAAFRASMRQAAICSERWERSHPTSPAGLLRAIAQLTRLFPGLRPDREPTPGERFPLL